MNTFKWVVGALFCIVILGQIIGTSSKVGPAGAAFSETPQQAALEPLKDSCSKLSKLLGYHSNLSDAQKDDLWERSYKGRQFTWAFQLVSAETAYDDDFDVTFVCLPPTGRPTLIKMVYPSDSKKTVLGFKKGRSYKISGVLTEYEAAPAELSDQVSVRFFATPVTEPDLSRIPSSK